MGSSIDAHMQICASEHTHTHTHSLSLTHQTSQNFIEQIPCLLKGASERVIAGNLHGKGVAAGHHSSKLGLQRQQRFPQSKEIISCEHKSGHSLQRMSQTHSSFTTATDTTPTKNMQTAHLRRQVHIPCSFWRFTLLLHSSRDRSSSRILFPHICWTQSTCSMACSWRHCVMEKPRRRRVRGRRSKVRRRRLRRRRVR